MQNFNKVLDTLIPLVPVYKKEDVDGYFECAIRLHGKLCSKPDGGTHKLKRATLAHMYRAQPALALKFIVALEVNGYFDSFTAREGKKTVTYCIPTDKLYELYKSVEPPDKFVTHPTNDVDYKEVRRGIKQDSNAFAMFSIAQPYFTINNTIKVLLQEFPVCDVKDPRRLSFDRAMHYANIYSNREFRFPWFRDSRGRACVASTVGFNPQGSDAEKSLVLPTKAEAVTETGFKAMVKAAIDYAEVELTVDRIVAIASDPEGNKDEWLAFDKPYCFMSMANMIKQVVEDPEAPVAAYPPLDGRCSGLQHWTALSKTNAISCRLGMEPEEADDGLDMYEFVASQWVSELPATYQHLASRKACKVPVMTFPYSATRTTSMDNIRDLFMAPQKWEEGSWVTTGPGLTYKECATVGSNLFDCVNGVLSPIVAGRDWLVECVSIITKKTKSSKIEWITPDGFRAMQDAFKTNRLRVSARYNGKQYRADSKVPQLGADGSRIPDIVAARNKIAPNVIHSLDATHLRMVATELGRLGIDAIWIHDSFAVHANYTEILYQIIVEQFIKLYSGNYLVELKQQWEQAYGVTLPEPPVDNTWDVNILRDCKRFFE